MTVIPLVQGDEIAGLEIRCQCGSRAVIDCVYEDAAGASTRTADAAGEATP